jgi:hypothetical protein
MEGKDVTSLPEAVKRLHDKSWGLGNVLKHEDGAAHDEPTARAMVVMRAVVPAAVDSASARRRARIGQSSA